MKQYLPLKPIKLGFKIWFRTRVLGKVRLNFGEKYGTKLPTICSGILWYGMEIRCYFSVWFRTLPRDLI